MSNLSELRQHLYAIEQTRQITNAMYLLSTSRMKKAMQNIDFNILYMKRLRSTVKDILSKTKHNEIHNRFIDEQNEGKVLFVVITSDKGLCGGYNSEIIKLAKEKMSEHKNFILLSIGSIGSDTFINQGITPDYTSYDILQHPSLYMANKIAENIIGLYIKHQVKQAYIVYTEYVSSAVQTPVCRRILPLLRRDFLDLEYELTYTAQPLFEPSVDAVFENVVSSYVSGFLYDVFMQASASENSARMAAMQNATENADKMIAQLSAKINEARQIAITNEIIEIAAASDVSGAV